MTRGFVEDLTDAELLVRSVPKANHIAWQLGHSIVSTRRLLLAIGRQAAAARGFRGGLYQGDVGLGRSGQVCHEGRVSGPDGPDEGGVAGGGRRHVGGRSRPASPERMRQRMPTVGVVLLMLGALDRPCGPVCTDPPQTRQAAAVLSHGSQVRTAAGVRPKPWEQSMVGLRRSDCPTLHITVRPETAAPQTVVYILNPSGL